jgi:cytochrome c oxidase cbb3-type subunit 3
MSTGWSLFVIALIVLNVAGCIWLLLGNRNVQIDPRQKGKGTGHDFDGIEELNNPLPAWWTWLFVATIAFGVVYFLLYPGFGNFSGLLGWTSANQYGAEVERADERYGPIFASFFARPIPELLDDERALEIGSRIFANNCTTCHGSDARGGKGFPNLTDASWIHGGTPEVITQTITSGRRGLMVPFGAVVGGEEGIADVTEYVLSLSGREHDATRAARGAGQFATICSACHQASGKGLQAMGAPDLTDDIWLHGGKREDIQSAVRDGLDSQMPAHARFLKPEQIHLVALYVYSLSAGETEDGP